MTALGNENLCAKAAKKRAHAIKTRLEAMGYTASLSHSYELLATSCGHRNWATMKAGLEKASTCPNPQEKVKVELKAPPRFGSVMGSINTKVLLRDEDLRPDNRSPQERFKEDSADDLTAWIAQKIYDGEGWAAWKGRIVALLTGLMRALVHRRDHECVKLNVEAIRTRLPYDRYVEFAREVLDSDLPDRTRRIMSAYVAGHGYLDDLDRGRSETLLETHSCLEDMISDALRMIETEMKWRSLEARRGKRLSLDDISLEPLLS